MSKKKLRQENPGIVPNFLTFDVEKWFNAEIPRRKLISPPDEPTDIEKQVDLFIGICNRLEIKSTCFVVGEVAEKKPHLVRKLHENGHEIASHSYAHGLVYNMTPDTFRQDLHKSIQILENITGEKVKGFRAPSLSVNANIVDWFYRILEEEGIIYSSSIFPGKTFLYGMPEAPDYINRVKNAAIIEIPQQLLNLLVLKTGVAGGAYLRLFPGWFIKKFIQYKNKQGNPAYIYIHPWELIYKKYPVSLSLLESIIQYWGIRRNPGKIESLCKSLKTSFLRMDVFTETFDFERCTKK